MDGLGLVSLGRNGNGRQLAEGHPEQAPRMLLGVQMPRQDQSIAYLIISK